MARIVPKLNPSAAVAAVKSTKVSVVLMKETSTNSAKFMSLAIRIASLSLLI